MMAWETNRATAPTIHVVRDPVASITAVATTSPPANSHSTPISREMGCVSCGSSA
jgi:hypothetical protein